MEKTGTKRPCSGSTGTTKFCYYSVKNAEPRMVPPKKAPGMKYGENTRQRAVPKTRRIQKSISD